MHQLFDKIKAKEFKVGVIGLGYVGLPLSLQFIAAGFEVIGFDVSKAKCKMLKEGKSYIEDIKDSTLQNLISTGRFLASNDFSKLSEVDSIHICVPTPLIKTSDPDMSFIIAACDQIKKYIKKNILIVLESTTYPGTTQEIFKPLLNSLKMNIGEDVFVAFSPERIDPGNVFYNLKNTPKIIGGLSENCTQVAKRIYQTIVNEVIVVSSTEVAEMVKLLENTFRSVNIALANEFAQICKILNIDSNEVIEAAATKPFGFMPFYPGPGLGGHCIPVDPHYLSWKLKTLNYQTRFIDLAAKINTEMPNYIVTLIQDRLNETMKSINGSNILVIGVAYKKNISDTRESPVIEIIKILMEKGANIFYHDPFVNRIDFEGNQLNSIELNEASIKNCDLTFIGTWHDSCEIDPIVKYSNAIVDTRNATSLYKDAKITKL